MSASSSVESLRSEIVASENTRADYLKLKLVAVGAIAAAALGFGGSGKQEPSLEYLLCLIPFACAFCDLLCAHVALRIRVIGAFLLVKREDDYESFVRSCRVGCVFGLENIATWISSGVLSALVLAYGVLDPATIHTTQPSVPQGASATPFVICGLFGVVLSVATYVGQGILAHSVDTKARSTSLEH
jgi:hypothetical protein